VVEQGRFSGAEKPREHGDGETMFGHGVHSRALLEEVVTTNRILLLQATCDKTQDASDLQQNINASNLQ
jgi:hypothetical protein